MTLCFVSFNWHLAVVYDEEAAPADRFILLKSTETP